ncbi:helix-turn-helix domain-containing protein [Brevibacillus porteri]|uniref:HTH cro/C1-type domain-containing protein n=1 Tax=Brevibacillus porteri TaxID=2126350 RepID=A0ABX5FJF7_9BACL|nr:helix-turn-helix transcriptional regulator [Brevibacillus porteri]MED1802982.1 helix-turn-helix transcriptional regulator [Brevibacillus porteri]MED2134658.1 helix-turn-helix transcriptional regulator [Brevibacillus porteri]MED2748163.1 helix-turn-helix transcriptional regulator [Brevibacillus porteri]MED2817486.1 helix-turn-helix transcriptional regulator [Brevibacillus porteri]MED2897794.1 helix-turn-helix transcriptional regulator [Brevibacillus porteri]
MTKQEVGAELKRLRKERGLSIYKLAIESGISHSYISQLERGIKEKPSPEILEKLATPLNVPYMQLMRIAGYSNQGDLDFQAMLDGLLKGILEVTDMGDSFPDSLLDKLNKLIPKYDSAFEDDFEFSPESLRKLISNSTWQQEWKYDLLIDVAVQTKIWRNEQIQREADIALDLVKVLEQKNITYCGHQLTDQDKQLITAYLDALFSGRISEK